MFRMGCYSLRLFIIFSIKIMLSYSAAHLNLHFQLKIPFVSETDNTRPISVNVGGKIDPFGTVDVNENLRYSTGLRYFYMNVSFILIDNLITGIHLI